LTGGVKNGADWRKSIMEATVHIGLQCYLKEEEEEEEEKEEEKKKKKKNLP
jgi:hypothetical protein